MRPLFRHKNTPTDSIQPEEKNPARENKFSRTPLNFLKRFVTTLSPENENTTCDSGMSGDGELKRINSSSSQESLGEMEILQAVLTLASVVHCYGPHHPRGPHHHYKPTKSDKTKLTQDMELLNDQMHIKEDLSAWVSQPDTSKMTPQELAFYYFKVHDFDNNTKLDGLEILQAIRHTIHEHGSSATTEDILFSAEDFQYYTELIDRVLAEDDLDGDGYLSYIEYALGREKGEKEQQKF